tara:strand:- start:3050 stop:3202 length:153 start_codon:yes stop_codon:yes gene_type:complete
MENNRAEDRRLIKRRDEDRRKVNIPVEFDRRSGVDRRDNERRSGQERRKV